MFVAMFGDESARDVTWSRYLRKMTVAGHRAPDVEVGLQKKFAALHSATSPFERVLLLAVQMGQYVHTPTLQILRFLLKCFWCKTVSWCVRQQVKVSSSGWPAV